MSPRARLLAPALLVVVVVVASVALAGSFGQLTGGPGGPDGAGGPGGQSGPEATGPAGHGGAGNPTVGTPTTTSSPTPRPPQGGTELYGYLPYWEMTDSTADYLDDVPLSTIALFSVSARRNGAIDIRPTGYDRIAGAIGRRIIDEAHERGARVELVFTSFGAEKNAIFFGRVARGGPATSPGTSAAAVPPSPSLPRPANMPWQRAVGELVGLVDDLGVDGLNVDVELLDDRDRDAYREFLDALRAGLDALGSDLTLSVATEAGPRGVSNAAAAAASGVDRVFLMGYDYHWSGSQPGASSPIERTDGLYDLRWSIDSYVVAGVPRDRILLGLPLYGMRWRTLGPDRTAPVVGDGVTWIPNRNLDVITAPGFSPARDPGEVAEFFSEPDGLTWLITYYDSPATTRAKLALARDHGLAGGGFWAIGYERDVPGYLGLLRDFRDGRVGREESPAP